MRLSRLIIEGNQNRVSLTLHPKLTVVAGVPGPVRAHLVDEILGGFTSARSGVHLEMVNGSGRRITVVRPTDAPHRVTAPDEKIDLTEDFRDSAGRTDVLARYGIDIAAKMHVHALIRKFTQDGGGVLVSSSDLSELARICDVVLAMRDRRIVSRIERKDGMDEGRLRASLGGLH